MSYNLTGIADNTTGILSFIQGVNNNLMRVPGTNGLGSLGFLFLITIGAIIYMAFMFSTGDNKKSLAATGFLLFGFSALLGSISLISGHVMFLFLFGAAAMIALSYIWTD